MPKVLIVEDDFMMADCLEEVLVTAGYEVCGIAGNVADAIRLGEQHEPDLGIVDLRLSDGSYGTDAVTALRRRYRLGDHPHTFGVLYATGNPRHPLILHAEGEGCIGKPYRMASLLVALQAVSDRIANVPVSLNLPKGFRMLNEDLAGADVLAAGADHSPS